MNSREIRDLTEAYLSVYEEVDKRRAPQELVSRLRNSTEGWMAQDGPNRPAWEARQRTLKRAHKMRLKAKENTHESYDLYDLVLDHLLDEGYANTVENAEVIMMNMSEEWINQLYEKVVSGYNTLPTSRIDDQIIKHINQRDNSITAGDIPRAKYHDDKVDTMISVKLKHDPNKVKKTALLNKLGGAIANTFREIRNQKPTNNVRILRSRNEEFEHLYDYIYNFLISEGYASTPEAAEKILECMSEGWLEDIIDEATILSVTSPKGTSRKVKPLVTSQGRQITTGRTTRQLQNPPRKLNTGPTSELRSAMRNFDAQNQAASELETNARKSIARLNAADNASAHPFSYNINPGDAGSHYRDRPLTDSEWKARQRRRSGR